MSMKANYHTHTFLCNHAEGHVEDYVKQAVEYGFEEIGMSDHGFVPVDPMTIPAYFRYPFLYYMREYEFYNSYLKHIELSKSLYGDKISILSGLECEYYYNCETHYRKLLEHLDYLALGQHIVFHEKTALDPYRDMNPSTVMSYAKNVSDALDSGFFKIIVHPDLFMFGYQDGQYKTAVFDEAAAKASRVIMEACIRNNVYLELNAGTARKGRRLLPDGHSEYYYPRSEFWKMTKEYPQLKIIIGADAHHPIDLFGVGVKNIMKFIDELQLEVHEKIKL